MIIADDIQERLIQFAAKIITLCDTLPHTPTGDHIAGQLLRSGTAPALNRVEALSTKTPAEYLRNLKLALKALDQSEFWLRIIIASDILSQNMLAPLITDCQHLQRILSAGINYANNPSQRQTINHQPPNYSTTRLPDYPTKGLPD